MSYRRLPSVGQVDVERVIAEVRAGRPAVLRDGAERLVVAAAEAFDETLVREFEFSAPGAARLVLSASRLRHLGLSRGEAGFVALPHIELARLRALAFGLDARVDAPVAPLTPLYEGALELMRLAQLLPAVVVLAASGAEALLPNLLSVSLPHLLGYRASRRATLRIVSRANVPLEGASACEFVVFRGGEGLRDQIAIVVGRPDCSQPVPVRLHSACLTGDLFGSLKCDCGDQLRHTVRVMAQEGVGVLLYLDQEGRGNGISTKIRAYDLQALGLDTFEADEALGYGHDQRDFAFAADMLQALGVTRVRLMTNNPVKIAALEEAGLEVVSAHRVLGRRNAHNRRYLAAKRDRAGHLLELDA
ncbi:GTP cyclohydrolase II RibA [Methylocystis bryophila]|uniref:GTP cyclohydrolase-2 n=1 Tax=Methylocystis bryophila TaxID=655015 RepID=A0A1W6MS83_9HYPH|nr:GTP cyclohydrolase II RibA [Methylocystis bryophila]ARN80473.1 GTP cyclohydrolase [Methylocystis bryophila]BDV40494.1 GTP cyclohydrolase-2 [Methylocystis bryophila]